MRDQPARLCKLILNEVGDKPKVPRKVGALEPLKEEHLVHVA